VDLLADMLCDVVQLREYMDSLGGPVSIKGQLYKPLDMYRGLLKDALSIFDRLGACPRARAQLVGSIGPGVSGGLVYQLAQRRRELILEGRGPTATTTANGDEQP
jgi:hypothetical protein